LIGQLGAYLAQEEIPAWIDNQLAFGDRWEDVIQQRIREARVFLIVMSDQSRASAFVAREIRLALDERKLIMPILLRGEPFDELAGYQYISLLDIPKTPRFVERLRDLLTPSRTPSVNVLRRRVSQLALATFEELLKPGEKTSVPVLLGFGLGQFFAVQLTDSLRDLDELDWVEAFMILHERLPHREFPFISGEDYGARYPTIQAFADFLATELTWEEIRSL
jgi:hypothetical protein